MYQSHIKKNAPDDTHKNGTRRKKIIIKGLKINYTNEDNACNTSEKNYPLLTVHSGLGKGYAMRV